MCEACECFKLSKREQELVGQLLCYAVDETQDKVAFNLLRRLEQKYGDDWLNLHQGMVEDDVEIHKDFGGKLIACASLVVKDRADAPQTSDPELIRGGVVDNDIDLLVGFNKANPNVGRANYHILGNLLFTFDDLIDLTDDVLEMCRRVKTHYDEGYSDVLLPEGWNVVVVGDGQ